MKVHPERKKGTNVDTIRIIAHSEASLIVDQEETKIKVHHDVLIRIEDLRIPMKAPLEEGDPIPIKALRESDKMTRVMVGREWILDRTSVHQGVRKNPILIGYALNKSEVHLGRWNLICER